MSIRTIAAVITLVMAASCSSGGTHLRNIPREQRQGLVVLNFKNNTPMSRAAEFQPWEFGIASMVMTDIEAIGMFNIVSKERLSDVAKEQEFQMSGMVGPKDIVELGRITGAKYILTGAFMEMNGALRLESQVFSVEKGSQLGTASVNGKTGSFFDLEKQLVSKVSEFLGAILTEEEQKKIASRVETKSVAASLSNYSGELAYLQANQLKKAGREEEAKRVIAEAKQNFQRAVTLDPAYEKARKNLSKVSLAIPVQL
jgi:TolB-like protein